MRSITVVIPSYKHADLLVNTLESVRQQTALGAVQEIIISENSEDNSTGEVCKKFSDLPINYIHNPQIKGMVNNWAWVIDQSKTKYTAMLHDDDWWYPTHLENGLKALETYKCGSYFSNFLFSGDEKLNHTRFHFLLINYLGDRIQSPLETIYLDLRDVMVLSYLYTPFHMSGIVAKTEVVQYANEHGLKKSDGWNADRSLYPYLAERAPIAFSPQYLFAVRSHNNQYSYQLAKENQQRNYDLFKSMSKDFVAFAGARGIDILKAWEDIRNSVSNEEWNVIVQTYLLHYGNEPSSLFCLKNNVSSSIPQRARKTLQWLMPYGLVRFLQQNRQS